MSYTARLLCALFAKKSWPTNSDPERAYKAATVFFLSKGFKGGLVK
jgi:hypothetical protein